MNPQDILTQHKILNEMVPERYIYQLTPGAAPNYDIAKPGIIVVFDLIQRFLLDGKTWDEMIEAIEFCDPEWTRVRKSVYAPLGSNTKRSYQSISLWYSIMVLGRVCGCKESDKPTSRNY